MSKARSPQQVAVLGCGAMGRQLAAVCANAGLRVLLFGLPRRGNGVNARAIQAIEWLLQQHPEPLTSPHNALLIRPVNYGDHVAEIACCDVVFEAIAERLDTKVGFYARIAPYLNRQSLLATTSESLSIDALAQGLPEGLRNRFVGTHFLNPPRYRPLVELAAGGRTDARVVNAMESFLVAVLGKDVVRVHDAPLFVAERINLFAMLRVFHYAQALGIAPEQADELLTPWFGRPFAQLSQHDDATVSRRIERFSTTLRGDPWVDCFAAPQFSQAVVNVERLAGGRWLASEAALRSDHCSPKEYGNLAGRILAGATSRQPGEQFLWRVWRDTWHYCAYHLDTLAPCARDIDHALRLGAEWSHGPFEVWQMAGWREVAQAVDREVAAGKTPVALPLPQWVASIDRVHVPKGSYAPNDNNGGYRPRPRLGCYAHQTPLLPLVGEAAGRQGALVVENEGIILRDGGDEVGVLSFKTAGCRIDEAVLNGLRDGIETAETRFNALIIAQEQPPFCSGLDWRWLGDDAPPKASQVERLLRLLQQTYSALRSSEIPVAAAVHGAALGVGCELLLQCDLVVAAQESRLGLSEGGGLSPMAGGSVVLLERALRMLSQGGEAATTLAHCLALVTAASPSQSAQQAQEQGLLQASDVIVNQPRILLHVAKRHVLARATPCYRPLPTRPLQVPSPEVLDFIAHWWSERWRQGLLETFDYRRGLRLLNIYRASGLANAPVGSADDDAPALVGHALAPRILASVEALPFAHPTTSYRVTTAAELMALERESLLDLIADESCYASSHQRAVAAL